jgi:hypothetical protein
VTREAAKGVGRWLEARGRRDRPIAALTLKELERMATAAISRFVVLASERIRERPQESEDLTTLLSHPGVVPSVTGRIAVSATPTNSGSTGTPATASARCVASMPVRRSHE